MLAGTSYLEHCISSLPLTCPAYRTTFGTQPYQSTWSWRIPTILQAGFPLVQLGFLWWVPESPRWLISKDRTAEAYEILAKYHTAGDMQHPLVVREMSEISETIKAEQTANATTWATLSATPGNRKRLFIVGKCLRTTRRVVSAGIMLLSQYLSVPRSVSRR